MRRLLVYLCLPGGLLSTIVMAQQPTAPPPPPPSTPPAPATPAKPPTTTGRQEGTFAERPATAPVSGPFTVAPGTRILLNMINSVSTKQAAVGDRIYLETAFPVLAEGRIVIPQGSWVTGTITAVKRPGRMKGRGELQVHFDSLVLPNGVARNFAGDLAAIDARDDQKLKREHSKISGPGNKGSDVGTVISSTTSGTVIGSGVGAAAGNVARGAGIGAGAGAAASLMGVMLTRGPDATLTRGSTVEMVLDRPLNFSEAELDFRGAPPRAPISEGSRPTTQSNKGWTSRLPL